MTNKIAVVMGKDIKREAVLIDPNISASDNGTTGAQAKNIIATGASSRQAASKIYGRK